MKIQSVASYNSIPRYQQPKSVEFSGFEPKFITKSYDSFVKSNADVSIFEALRCSLIRGLESEIFYLNFLKSTKRSNRILRRMIAYKPLCAKTEHEFAQTLKQAEEFAQKNLGIEDFAVESKEIANIINSAITKVSNYAEGNIFLPLEVRVCELDGDTLGRSSVMERTMLLNSKLYKRKNLDICSVSNPVAIMEKMYYTIFHELGHFVNMHKHMIEVTEPAATRRVTQKLKKVIEFRQKIIEHLENEIAMYPKEDLPLKQKIKILLNRKEITADLEKSNAERKELMSQFRKITDDYDIWNAKRDDLIFSKEWDTDEIKIASKISNYAQTNETEFLAEVFAHICQNGLSSIPDDAMQLYKSRGGVILPNFPK